MSMQIVPPRGATHAKKRLGRGQGSGLGTTSGKGHKGQKARSGGSGGPYIGFEGGQVPLYRRLATRGFTNARFAVNYTCVNLFLIEKVYEAGEEVTVETLKAKGLIKNKENLVKILAKGDLTKGLTFSTVKISEQAKSKIEKVGGKVL
ncbi:50S ribosomal protein L15 [Entomospira nematocerorum]|uniref:Large ribosomal subunit protein uL15 n=2 Tax=Entomospira TaxID=2834378 RepID=A0A968GDH9_9SPIO|nr:MULTISPECIES: 50S ribosomal protein L15 [Entomospira]NIZ40235.1 50S ribosomal protein L15 [Entomospira entomophilus]NIZ47259.1 50S ribosomal protein L15 [Entomospira nematocera]WDI34199.1 50S ribosomal protein L15 [Entomospira nematocera]WDI35794.1 50S ribosomal protein L15 [Entomospira entomophilus]